MYLLPLLRLGEVRVSLPVEAPEDYREALQEQVQDIARQVGLPLDTSLDASDSEPAQLSF